MDIGEFLSREKIEKKIILQKKRGKRKKNFVRKIKSKKNKFPLTSTKFVV